ncbi:MAG: succinyldiaminopimelate transaminase [Frankiales bacterium]|nr:succinyldiaminopimelate transaminase [Frankiales bacterium]
MSILRPPGDALPDFPWDRLAPYAAIARRHSDGIVDLSVGTPVDGSPAVAQAALTAASDAPGYPLTAGTPTLRAAIGGWLQRRCGAVVPADGVLPVIGTKELVALLPSLLGAPAGSTVLHPALAYPTYDIGARLAGARPVPYDDLPSDATNVALLWVNSPANPHGRVLSVDELRAHVAWARAHDVVLVSDECYLDFGWGVDPVSVLHPSVNDGSLDGLLAVHSLSKRSNLAGYRAGFVAGDPTLVQGLLGVRKHAGLIVPAPVQVAMVAALGDEEHVQAQRIRYAARRAALLPALAAAGFRIEHSEAGLYLWATRDEACWDSVAWLADRGVLVAPGEFYGAAGGSHVRIALTATDERVAAAATRLSA